MHPDAHGFFGGAAVEFFYREIMENIEIVGLELIRKPV
jgi:hypothetical protein